MPIMAPKSTASRVQCRVCECVSRVSFFMLLTTGAASSISDCHGTIPVSTTATAMYRTVHTIKVAMMPMGKSRCGLRASSAAVETESNPM